jgi:hypothetical protein
LLALDYSVAGVCLVFYYTMTEVVVVFVRFSLRPSVVLEEFKKQQFSKASSFFLFNYFNK